MQMNGSSCAQITVDTKSHGMPHIAARNVKNAQESMANIVTDSPFLEIILMKHIDLACCLECIIVSKICMLKDKLTRFYEFKLNL